MSQTNKSFIVLEWTFSPPNYFNTPVRLNREMYAMAITGGKFEVQIDASLYDTAPSLQQAIDDVVIDWFLGAQLATGAPYELSAPTVTRVYVAAESPAQPEPEVAGSARAMDAPIIGDADGTTHIAVASQQERIEEEPSAAQISEPYSTIDPLLESLLRRYDAAISDPAHELSLLCDVPEALSTTYGSASAARAALGISERDWSRLTDLADCERGQGRIGYDGVDVRPEASEGERAEARAAALRMILAYFRRTESESGSASG